LSPRITRQETGSLPRLIGRFVSPIWPIWPSCPVARASFKQALSTRPPMTDECALAGWGENKPNTNIDKLRQGRTHRRHCPTCNRKVHEASRRLYDPHLAATGSTTRPLSAPWTIQGPATQPVSSRKRTVSQGLHSGTLANSSPLRNCTAQSQAHGRQCLAGGLRPCGSFRWSVA
jgi:hypothetical protein